MAAIRRNIKPLSAVTLFILLSLFGWWMISGKTPAALASDTTPPLDPVNWGHVQTLRTELGLDDDTLAVLNPSDAQLQSLFTALRQWYDTNATDYIQRQTALADQRALVRYYESAIRCGENASDALSEARQRLTRLTTEYAAYLESVRTALGNQLSDTQRQVFARMLTQRNMVMPYRALELDQTQRTNLKRTKGRYAPRLQFAEEESHRDRIRTTFQNNLTEILGPAKLRQLQELRGYLGDSSQRVAAAAARYLALEEEEA